jgi:predicted aspartyl protease
MSWLRFGAAFYLAAGVIFAGPAMAEDCTLKQLASLQMADNFPGRVVVTATINGAPHPFMVDTGGLVTELYDDVVQKLGLTSSTINPNVEIYDTSGNLRRRYVRVEDFALGPMHAEHKVMVVKPRGPGEDEGIDGIIGPDVLEHLDVEFDFGGRKLNLISPDHCEGKVVYWSQSYTDTDFSLSDDHVVIPMMLDGKEVQATLDTGAPATYLSETAAHRLFGIDIESPGIERDSGAPPGSPYAYRYKFRSLSVAGLAVNNPLVHILPDLARQAFNRRHQSKEDLDPVTAPQLKETPMLLGMDVLSKLHLYIAYKERKLYITGANAH